MYTSGSIVGQIAGILERTEGNSEFVTCFLTICEEPLSQIGTLLLSWADSVKVDILLTADNCRVIVETIEFLQRAIKGYKEKSRLRFSDKNFLNFLEKFHSLILEKLTVDFVPVLFREEKYQFLADQLTFLIESEVEIEKMRLFADELLEKQIPSWTFKNNCIINYKWGHTVYPVCGDGEERHDKKTYVEAHKIIDNLIHLIESGGDPDELQGKYFHLKSLLSSTDRCDEEFEERLGEFCSSEDNIDRMVNILYSIKGTLENLYL